MCFVNVFIDFAVIAIFKDYFSPPQLNSGFFGESVGKYINLYLINVRYFKIIMLIICLSYFIFRQDIQDLQDFFAFPEERQKPIPLFEGVHLAIKT